MDVIILAPGPWKILAELEVRENGKRCSVIDDMKGLGANYTKSRAGLVYALEQFAKEGPANNRWIEPASSTDPKVYKFVKGDLRLYFVHADGAVIVCSGCVVKKSQKTDKKSVRPALLLHKRYTDAVSKQDIREIRDHEHLLKLR